MALACLLQNGNAIPIGIHGRVVSTGNGPGAGPAPLAEVEVELLHAKLKAFSDDKGEFVFTGDTDPISIRFLPGGFPSVRLSGAASAVDGFRSDGRRVHAFISAAPLFRTPEDRMPGVRKHEAASASTPGGLNGNGGLGKAGAIPVVDSLRFHNAGYRDTAIALEGYTRDLGDVLMSGQARGAAMPYLSYQAEDGTLGKGAVLKGPSMDDTRVEAEASGREYVELAQTGAYVEWKARKAAQGMVLRFTMPDSPDGVGMDATLGLYLNGTRIAGLPLSSRFAWQYFDAGNNPTNAPGSGRPLMRFDEIRFAFPKPLAEGDVVRLQKDAGDAAASYGIDFIEMEPIPDPIAAPTGSIDVTSSPYLAKPGDDGDDFAAFQKCIADAKAAGKTAYIPPGRFRLSQRLAVSGVQIQGAGIWRTELQFNDANSCGFTGGGGVVVLKDMYLASVVKGRAGDRSLQGWFGPGSKVMNLWSEHFRSGAWIADYGGKVTDGLLISGCRFRDTYADGCNLAQGTRNTIVENTHFRNNGDDAMAIWPSGEGQVPEETGNVFRFNTAENTYRASGLGIFGGKGHEAHDCIIRDVVRGPGIRFNTVFPGYPFSAASDMLVTGMTLERIGSTDSWGDEIGAITLETSKSPVHNLRFQDIDIIGPKFHGVCYKSGNGNAITDIHFDRVRITGAGKYGLFVKDGATGWSENANVSIQASGLGTVYDNSPLELRKTQGNVGW